VLAKKRGDMTSYADDNAYPFLTVAYIETRFEDQWFQGSGVLVGRNDILTASHVVYDPSYGLGSGPINLD
jgi:V8-like Glu-specific endopeptidase